MYPVLPKALRRLKPSRRWAQFSLRTMLVAVTVVCVLLGLLTQPVMEARKERAAIQAILNLNGMGETAAVEINENSQLLLLELIQDKEEETQQTLLDLAIGKVLIRAQKLHSEKSKFEVKTPTSIVGVRGTTFAVEVEALD